MVESEIVLIPSKYNEGLHLPINDLVTNGIIISVVSVTTCVLIGFVISRFIRLMLGKV